MPLMDPTIKAECDKCRFESDEMSLTPLAQSGSYDERNVPAAIRRMGWVIQEDGATYCPECKPKYD